MLRRLRALLPFDRYVVEGESMLPEVAPAERVLASRLAYWLGRPRPGDLIVLRDPREPQRLLLKRVEKAEGAGSWSVVGDNTDASTDSRTFGPVSKDLILGKVVFRY